MPDPTQPALTEHAETLFGPAPEPPPKLSAGQKLTKRNAELLARGRHPATLLPLLGSDDKCGDCSHHHRYSYRDDAYHKCDQHRLGESHSAASDVRVGWPACVRFEREVD